MVIAQQGEKEKKQHKMKQNQKFYSAIQIKNKCFIFGE